VLYNKQFRPLLRHMFPLLPRFMDYRRILRCSRRLLVATLLWFAIGGDCDAAVREYAVISVKIGTAASTPVNTGTLVFELWPDLAPKTVQNFKHLANTGFYDATASHRLIKNFMIQAGDPLTRNPAYEAYFGQGGPNYGILDEFADPSEAQSWQKRRHLRGTLSMANKGSPSTGGSQFFVMFSDNADLDGNYSSFGRLIDDGMSLEFLENKLNTQITRNPSAFDLNRDGAFDALEKSLICGVFNQNPEVLTYLSEPLPDTRGFIDINADGALTIEEIDDARNKSPLDLPSTRIEIQSVRVWAIDDAMQVGTPVPFSYESTTHSGLLRPPDRSEIMGRYNVTVQRSGAFSAVVEYLARRVSFSGKFDTVQQLLPDSNIPERRANIALQTVLSDYGSAFPFLVELRLHNTYSSGSPKNSIGVTVASSQSFASGFSESLSTPSRNSLSTRYTVRAQPTRSSQYSPSTGLRADNISVTGNSHFSMQVTPSLGISLLSGRFANGVPFTASRILGSEHGATVLPIYTCSFPSSIESLRSTFPQYNLAALYQITYGYARSLAFGWLQLGDKSRTEAQFGDLTWLHPETTFSSAPLKNRLVVNNLTATTPWRAPTANAVMRPFYTVPARGQLLINGNALNFTVSNNITATFQQPTGILNPFLRFDPRTGEFSGYFFETTPSLKRRVFSGTLLDASNANGGFGYYLDANSSKSVQIIPLGP
jgi:cyclophilin family peptidyl-prolyl cis-trans isomerase